MRQRLRMAAATMLVPVAACGSKPAAIPSAVEVIPVTTVRASTAGAAPLTLTGTVRFKRETGLAFNSAGRIAAITAVEGQPVAAGQPLARLDSTGLDASASAAAADAVRAHADYARLAQLGQQGWVTRPRVESAAAATAAAEARVDQTRFDVRFGRIAAPVAGIVLRRAFEPGQMVAAGVPVVTIGELASGYVVRVPVSDADLARVRVGDPAEIVLPALSPAPIAAAVSELAGRGDDRTGTFQVEFRLPPRPGLRSGLIGTATIRPRGGNGALTVPAAAVFAVRADEGFVYVLDAARATVHPRLVGLGALGDRSVVVTRGLDSGTPVVTSGVDRLRNGARVRLVAGPAR